jgi:hypothetical protein
MNIYSSYEISKKRKSLRGTQKRKRGIARLFLKSIVSDDRSFNHKPQKGAKQKIHVIPSTKVMK